MKEASGITITVDGQSTDLADVTWLEVAPCGCASGCVVAWLPPPYSVINVTTDQAADDYYETKAGRAQAERRGFVIKAILRERLTDYMNTDCLHIPKWGYERPVPDGMGWAVAKWGRAKVMHLVPSEVIDPEKGSSSAHPLCSKAETYGWSHMYRAGQPDCEKCIKVALEQGVLV